MGRYPIVLAINLLKIGRTDDFGVVREELNEPDRLSLVEASGELWDELLELA